VKAARRRKVGSVKLASELTPASHWACPCGMEKPKPGQTTTPVRTVVSLIQPRCPFCGKAYRDEYRMDGAGSTGAEVAA
jgi:hypothetical protein